MFLSYLKKLYILHDIDYEYLLHTFCNIQWTLITIDNRQVYLII